MDTNENHPPPPTSLVDRVMADLAQAERQRQARQQPRNNHSDELGERVEVEQTFLIDSYQFRQLQYHPVLQLPDWLRPLRDEIFSTKLDFYQAWLAIAEAGPAEVTPDDLDKLWVAKIKLQGLERKLEARTPAGGFTRRPWQDRPQDARPGRFRLWANARQTNSLEYLDRVIEADQRRKAEKKAKRWAKRAIFADIWARRLRASEDPVKFVEDARAQAKESGGQLPMHWATATALAKKLVSAETTAAAKTRFAKFGPGCRMATDPRPAREPEKKQPKGDGKKKKKGKKS